MAIATNLRHLATEIKQIQYIYFFLSIYLCLLKIIIIRRINSLSIKHPYITPSLELHHKVTGFHLEEENVKYPILKSGRIIN